MGRPRGFGSKIDFEGLPVDRNLLDEPWIPQRIRPRRNRKSAWVRSMVREVSISPSNLIYPLFIMEDTETDPKKRGGKVEISSMPNCYRHTLPSMMKEIDEAVSYGVGAVVLFPMIDPKLKSNLAEEAYNPSGLIPQAIKLIKEKHPDLFVITDIALDPYSDQGHDGVVHDGQILNDITIVQLQKQALMHAHAGADMVAPSDMMDGRVGAIRDALDQEGFTSVSILSYTAKYASSFYGPFRDALDSHPGFGDKKTYQQDPGNGREAILEAILDEQEGADMMMVKPGMPYLDIVRRLRDTSTLPIAAYQVSGEYAMIKAASRNGWLDEKKTVLESLLCFRRAGADAILTYYAKDCAKWLQEDAVQKSAPLVRGH